MQTSAMGFSGRIAALFVRSRLTPLLAALALLLGVFAVLVTPREEEPQIDVTMANVLVPFPGASAKEVEALVAIPAEQVLAQMEGVKHVYSVSKTGQAIVTVQFDVGVGRSEALVRLYNTVHSNRDWLPREARIGEPLVKPKGIDDVPIVALTLWTREPNGAAFDLERVAHAIEADLKRVAGTREVQTIGGPGRAVRVVLDVDRLNAYRLSIGDVRQAIQEAHASLPVGQLVANNATIDVQTGQFLTDAAAVRELVVGVDEGRPIYLSDVSEVVDGPPPSRRYVWHGTVQGEGGEYPAVTLWITKKPGANAVEVARAIAARVAELRNTVIPDGVEVSVSRDYGATASDKALTLIRKLVFATLAVVALVFAALGRREALIVGGAVVLTLAATLFASWAWGFTLNRVSLFALIFSIGILVDDAIVVVENIHRHHALSPWMPLIELVPGAVDEVGGPTILATLTVIAALLPMAFVTGLMGPYMSPIPINASLGMLISLAVAFVVTPWLAVRLTRQSRREHGASDANAKGSRLDERLQHAFTRVLAPFLVSPRATRNRVLLGAAMVVAIVASMSLALFQSVVLKMLPFDNKSELQVVVDMPAGTPVEATAALLHDIAAHVRTVPEVVDYQAYAGTATPINFNGLLRQYDLRQSPEFGDLQIRLLDKSKRDRTSHEIAVAVRPGLARMAAERGAAIKVVEVPPGPPVLAPIVAEVYGPDEAGRHRVASRIRAALAQTPGIVDVDDSIDEAAPKMLVRIDQVKAAARGVTPAQIVAAMRVALDGEDVATLHDEASRYAVPVRLALPASSQADIEPLLSLSARNAAGDTIPLKELVQVVPLGRDQTLYRKDLLPVSYVVADTAGSVDSPLYGMFAARAAIRASAGEPAIALDERWISQPSDPYRAYAYKWDGEWQITYETFRDMGIAYAVGLVLIYLLIVGASGSYVTPLVIMAPIPLTVIGILPGHAMLGAPFTATSMIGMIALAGIIVRNSILLVDFVDVEVRRGMPLADAVVSAAATRAKPIALTALSAMLGALFILDDPIFNGLAIALVFGILISTLLTLIVIPVLHYAVQRNRHARPDLAKETFQ